MTITQTIAVAALETEAGRKLLSAADVVYSRDVMLQRDVLVYGRDAAGEIEAGTPRRSYRVLAVELDADVDGEEIEYLLLVLAAVKGGFQYTPSTTLQN